MTMTKPPRLSLRRAPLLLILVFWSQIPFSCHGFAFQIPRIRLPWDPPTISSDATAINSNVSKKSPVQRSDKIVVFGGTGGVGQLITRKLLAREGKAYNVCVVARNASRARELLLNYNDEDEDDNNNLLEISEMDLVGETKATDDQLRNAMVGSSGIVISVGTTAFPTQRWRGGNTPQAIDSEAVSRIARLAADIPTMRRIV